MNLEEEQAMPLETEDSQCRFEIDIWELDADNVFKVRRWEVTQAVVDWNDTEYIKCVFAEFPKRLQTHVVLLSRMFLAAAQDDEPPPTELTMTWHEKEPTLDQHKPA